MQILVFQHLDVEHPGVFREFWTDAGHEWSPIELDRGEIIPSSLERFDVLVVMGGPMDVWEEDLYPWLIAEKAAIRHWVRELGRPFLGICLGHQMLAEALGGSVARMERPEVGLKEVALTAAGRQDRLFEGLGRSLQTFQWHSSGVARLPQGAVVLAENDACPVQAFRWGRHAYGLQYHCEITAETVAEWDAVPAYAASLREALGDEEASRLSEVVAGRLPAFRKTAQGLNDNLWAFLMDVSRQHS